MPSSNLRVLLNSEFKSTITFPHRKSWVRHRQETAEGHLHQTLRTHQSHLKLLVANVDGGLFNFIFIYLSSVYMHCMMDKLQQSVPSFYPVGSRNQIQLSRPGSKHLYSLSHLAVLSQAF